MEATKGRIVHYKLGEYDAQYINGATGRKNEAHEGDIYPAIVVRTFGKCVNLQVFYDGDGSLWVTSRSEGDAYGQWSWPPRV